MDKEFEILSRCALFEGMDGRELSLILNCLGGRREKIARGEPAFLEGDPAQCLGVVLEGAVQILREEYDGGRSVMAVAEPGEMFAEAFACAGIESLPVSAIALKDSRVLLLDHRRVLEVCPRACAFHNRLVSNLLKVLARKNLALSSKIQIMSQRTTREKIMAYLHQQAKMKNAREFTIPWDRQGLADYLGVERSAMSAEIGKLKKEGSIDTRGSWFRLP